MFYFSVAKCGNFLINHLTVFLGEYLITTTSYWEKGKGKREKSTY